MRLGHVKNPADFGRGELNQVDEQIARLLVEGGFVGVDDVAEAIKVCREQGVSLREALVFKNAISEQTYNGRWAV